MNFHSDQIRFSKMFLNGYDALPDPVYLFDKRQTLLYCNPAALKYFKQPTQNPQYTTNQLFPDALITIIQNGIEHAFKDNKNVVKEICTNETDMQRFLRIRFIPLSEDESPGTIILCIISDYTSLWDTMLNSNSNNQKNASNDDTKTDESGIHSLSFQQNHFITTMTHEIRTPLNGIIGITELLSQTALSENQKEYTRIIQMSCDSLMSIINSILDFSKYENCSIQSCCEYFSPVEAIFTEISLIIDRVRIKNVEIGILFEKTVPDLCGGDEKYFRQIVQKLLDNAIKFTEKGNIFIRVQMLKNSLSQHMLQVIVSDTGIGISPDKHKYLFTPFYQVDNSAVRKHRGIGLGLALSQRLVRLLGGQIHFCSIPEFGSTFSFSVPVSIEKKKIDTFPAFLHKKRVLCIDISFPTNKILGQYLSDAAAHVETQSFKNFINQQLYSGQYNIIMFDNSLPPEHLEHLIALKNSQRTDIPYVIFTPSTLQNVSLSLFQIQKPFTRLELYNALSEVFEIKKPIQQPI